MKRQILAILCASALTLSFSACAGSSGSASNAAAPASTAAGSNAAAGSAGGGSKQITIGFAFNDVSGDTYMSTYYSTAKSYAQQLGVNLLGLDAATDVTKQANQVKDLISKKVDVLCLWPTNSQTGVTLAKEAHDAGIPVVNANTGLDASGKQYVKCYVGPSNQKEGEATAKQMITDLGGKGKFLYIDGRPGYSTSIERKQGFMDGVKGSAITCVESQSGQSSRDKSQQVMENYLVKYPKGSVQAVACLDDNEAIGAINALKAAGRTDIKVYAMALGDKNSLPYVKDGSLAGVPIQSPFTDAQTTINYAVKIAKGEEIDTYENDIETPMATPANIDTLKYGKLG